MPSHKVSLFSQNFFPVVETHNIAKSTFLHCVSWVLLPEWGWGVGGVCQCGEQQQKKNPKLWGKGWDLCSNNLWRNPVRELSLILTRGRYPSRILEHLVETGCHVNVYTLCLVFKRTHSFTGLWQDLVLFIVLFFLKTAFSLCQIAFYLLLLEALLPKTSYTRA